VVVVAEEAQEVAVGRQVILQLVHPRRHISLAQVVLVAVQQHTDLRSLQSAINLHTPLDRAPELTRILRNNTLAVMFLQNQPTPLQRPQQQELTHLAPGTEEGLTLMLILVTIP